MSQSRKEGNLGASSVPESVKATQQSQTQAGASTGTETSIRQNVWIKIGNPLLTSTPMFEDLTTLGCFVGLAHRSLGIDNRPQNFGLNCLLGQRMKFVGGIDGKGSNSPQRKGSEKLPAQVVPEFASISTVYGKPAANIKSKVRL